MTFISVLFIMFVIFPKTSGRAFEAWLHDFNEGRHKYRVRIRASKIKGFKHKL